MEKIIEKLIEMGRIIPVPVWMLTIILALFGGITGITGYAYASDKEALKEDVVKNEISIENNALEIEKVKIITATKEYVKEKISEHEARQTIEYNNINENVEEIKITQKEQNKLLIELLQKN